MKQSLTRKLLWLSGTLLIGALGSGLWEAALKPSLLWVGTLMLDLATLGLTSLRDEMYADGAKGTYERAGVMILSIGTGVMCGMLISLPFIRRLVRKEDRDGASASRVATFVTKPLVFWTIPIALSIVLFVQLFRVSYVVRAANHIEQLQRITAPFISEDQRFVYQSRFAQVTSRHEYLQLVVELREIAVKNGAKPPQFNVY